MAITSKNLLPNPVLAILLAMGVTHLPALLMIPVITYFQVHSYSYILIPVFCDALIIMLGLLMHPLMRKKFPYKGNS